MAMLLCDYGDIITDVLCNSHPDFYTDYLKREFKKLNEQGYLEKEIKYNIEEVIKLIRSQIERQYNKNLATYNEFSEADIGQPEGKRYNYPKPDINNIPILRIKFPSGKSIDLSSLNKKFYLDDVVKVEKALNELLNIETGTGEDGTNIGGLKNSQIKNNFDLVDINEVYQHFKTGLVDKKYLSENELLKFIDAAFNKKTPPKKLFTLQDVQAKQKITNVFADYYKNKAGKPKGKQKEYASLLGAYFIGYKTKTVSSNFGR